MATDSRLASPPIPASTTTFRPPGLGRKMWHRRGRYLFLLPGIIYFILFAYVPLLGNIIALRQQ